ncbi:MAG: alpha/beta fold hydrolase [Lautropia sp.]
MRSASAVTLLLIPGLMNTARVWSDAIAALPPEVRSGSDIVIADPTRGDSIDAMAEAAWQQVAGRPGPLAIAGFSMGGYVALRMLQAPRDPVAAALLLSTSARPESPEAAALREKTIAAIGRDFGKVIDRTLAFCLGSAARDDPAVVGAATAMMQAVGAEAAARQNRAAIGRTDARDWLGTLRLPMIVGCSREDPVTPFALSEELAAGITGARLVAIEGAGHLVPLERPAQVAGLLAELVALARAPAAAGDRRSSAG